MLILTRELAIHAPAAAADAAAAAAAADDDDDDDDDDDVMTSCQLDDYLLHWQPPTIYIVYVYS